MTTTGSTTSRTSGWLTSVDDLVAHGAGATLIEHVVVTAPQHQLQPAAMSLGKAIQWALKGDTRGVNALVGYFGHGSTAAAADDDPVSIILREGQEELCLGHDPDGACGFRLSFGALSPGARAAQFALRAWYWICRANRPGGPAEAWVNSVFTAAATLKGAADGFAALARGLLLPKSGPHAAVAPLTLLWSDSVTPFDGAVVRLRERALFRDWQRQVRGEVTEVQGLGPHDERRRRYESATQLLAFMLLRNAIVRVGGAPSAKDAGEPRFHAKVYVVERASDSVAVVGSGNWSRAAFSSGNIEVSTLHVVPGHGFDGFRDLPDAPSRPANSVGSRVIATARALFNCGRLLGTLRPSNDETMTAVQMMRATDLPGTAVVDEEAETCLDSASVLLRRMIETTISVGHGESAERLQSFLVDAATRPQGGRLFGGKRAGSYQVDGAIRLLDILERPSPLVTSGDQPGRRARGAFLTDEAGLGKTLIAQLVAFQLIVDRLRARLDAGDDLPLRVTFLAPKQLAGDENETVEPRLWAAHATEVRDAVAAALESTLAGHGKAASWLADHLIIRVLSVSSVTRPCWDVSDKKRDEILAVNFHVAQSEIVVIDECHNLRNASSRKARIIRFLLSLPVPGERWGPKIGEVEPSAKGVERFRSVLGLSATPFNNDLQDLITQLGHFATRQNWTKVADRLKQATPELPFADAPLTIATAVERVGSNLTEDDRAAAFRHLYHQATEHFGSSRALDWLKAEEASSKGKTQQTPDGGPAYEWGPGYDRLKNDLPSIAALLPDRDSGSSDAPTPADQPPSPDAPEALGRLDALLAAAFVQRSRARVLRAMAPSEAEKVFRAPRRPRVPLGLNRWGATERLNAAFEEEVLRQLFTLVGKMESRFAGEAAPDGSDGRDPTTLTLLAYQLAAFRGRDEAGVGGSDVQSARNAFGFQLLFLVKRLQSSPYAFLRTLVRGVLRSSLRVLLAVRKVDPARAHVAHAGALRVAHQTVDAFVAELAGRDHIAVIAGMLGGSVIDASLGSVAWLESVIGVAPNVMASGKSSKVDTSEPKRVQAWTVALAEALGVAAQADGHFLPVLLGDLAGSITDSGLMQDARLCLDWTLGSAAGGRSLYREVYPHEAMRDGEHAFTFADFRERLGRWVQGPASIAETSGWASWVLRRLAGDNRLRSVVGLLAIQALARVAYGADPDLLELLPAGHKALLFTEYGDTVDYVSVALLAVSVAARHGSENDKANLRTVVTSAMREVSQALNDASHAVQREMAPDAHVDPTAFQSPVDGDVLVARLALPDTLAMLDEALRRLAVTAASCTGEGSRYLAPPIAGLGTTGAQAPIEDDDGLTETSPFTRRVIDDDAVLDAFSPHYQIAPPPPAAKGASYALSETKARELVTRFRRAAADPVHALLATQVLAEGVNFQECGVVIHLDLPWNPTNLIQRNGRVDRRLTHAYESDSRRTSLREALARAANETVAQSDFPTYIEPRQVYQLTVVPPEPPMTGPDGAPDPQIARFVESVRRTLLRKLRSIRVLFGITSWPIVLTATEANAVLTGTLDFETPALRRREELFAAYRALRTADERLPAEARAAIDGRSGTLVLELNVGSEVVESLRAVLPPGVAWPPSDLGILLRSPWEGELVPCRSGNEWHNKKAITGWVLEAGGESLVGLRHKPADGVRRHRAEWARFAPVRQGTSFHDPVAIESAETTPANVVSSPTGLAEELLRLACLSMHDGILDVDAYLGRDIEFPATLRVEPGGAAPESAGRWLPWLPHAKLQRAFSRLAEPFAKHTESSRGWNLWIHLS